MFLTLCNTITLLVYLCGLVHDFAWYVWLQSYLPLYYVIFINLPCNLSYWPSCVTVSSEETSYVMAVDITVFTCRLTPTTRPSVSGSLLKPATPRRANLI